MLPRTFLHRRYEGFGDWLFALAVARMVNRQQPRVQLHVKHRVSDGLQAQAWKCSDVKWIPSKPRDSYVDVYELIYRKWPPNNYIESTVANWNDLVPAHPIEYEHNIFPIFCNGRRWHGHGNYAVMIGHSKTTARGGREWGFNNWDALCRELSRKIEIIQVGHQGSRLLRSVRAHKLGRRFPELVDILCGAKFFIGSENGLTVLCGYLGVPQVTIYDGHQIEEPHNRCSRTEFSNQHKIARRIEPAEALEEIMTWHRF